MPLSSHAGTIGKRRACHGNALAHFLHGTAGAHRLPFTGKLAYAALRQHHCHVSIQRAKFSLARYRAP
jgi:hypothetical protein